MSGHNMNKNSSELKKKQFFFENHNKNHIIAYTKTIIQLQFFTLLSILRTKTEAREKNSNLFPF